MCNINILVIKNKVKPVTPFLMGVTSHSYLSNDDGEGFYCDTGDYSFKSLSKVNYFDFKDKLESSKIIITHQRLSTSGHTIEYVHPFINKDFVMVHNGVIDQFKKKKGSDTYGFWIAFNEGFKSATGNRKQRINKTIQGLFKDDLGSYSIFIYDKVTGQGHYFKDSSTNINFYENSNYLFITTNDSNGKLLDLIDSKKFSELKIEPRVIYTVYNNSKPNSVYISGRLPEVKLSETIQNVQTHFDDTFTLCENCGKYTKAYPSQINYKMICVDCQTLELMGEL